MTAYLYTYNVTGTLSEGTVFLTLTNIQAHSAKEAIAKAVKDEPDLIVTTIVRTSSEPEKPNA
jgi:hypothetical protein